jgi:predicted NUDIX family NTP pyrophosphohydrolase
MSVQKKLQNNVFSLIMPFVKIFIPELTSEIFSLACAKDHGKQRQSVNQDHILFFPLTDLKNKFSCQQRPAKGHFCVFRSVVFKDSFNCSSILQC